MPRLPDVHLRDLQHEGGGVLRQVSGRFGRNFRSGGHDACERGEPRLHVNARADLESLGFGIAVGHATDEAGATGCTVIRGGSGPFRASARVVGRATGTREVALLHPDAANDRVDAILLTGGSAYGLDAAAGVMRWMEEHGRGFPIAGGVVPIVPAAVVFDLAPLGRFDARPTPTMAYEACERATSAAIAEGDVGSGTGCTVGKVLGFARCMKGGFGVGVSGDRTLAAVAFVAVNAFGHVCGADGTIIAGARGEDGALVDTAAVLAAHAAVGSEAANTTIAVVAVNVALTKPELHELAQRATAALQSRVVPFGTRFDGDVIFAIAPMEGARGTVDACAPLAVGALEEAIERAVRLAHGREGIPGLAD